MMSKSLRRVAALVVTALALVVACGLAVTDVAYADDPNDVTYESGHYYHIDVRVAGTFTYTTEPSSEQVVPIVSVTKVWDDAETVDHADDVVTVYLLGEDGEQLYDSTGAARTVTLSAENGWTATIEDDDVYYVSEAAVAGYEASYSYGLTVSTEEGTSYTTTGTITVTGITAVSYVNEDGETVRLDVSLYAQQKSEDPENYPYEFFYDVNNANGGRRLSDLLTSSTVTITVAYDYSYVDENGVTQTGSATGTFTYSDLATASTCAHKDDESTEAGFDAVITADMLTESVYTSIYTRSATITNTPVDDGEDEVVPETEDEEETTEEETTEEETTEEETTEEDATEEETTEEETTEEETTEVPATADGTQAVTGLVALLGLVAVVGALAMRERVTKE